MRVLAAIAAVLAGALLAWAGTGEPAWDCVACHPARDPVVYAKLKERLGNAVTNISARETVCRTCHNGSLLDHRKTFARPSGNHRTGMAGKPNSLFPLYDGRVECGTCHTPHPDGKTTLGRPGWLRTSPSRPFPCEECHLAEINLKKSHQGLKASPAMRETIQKRGGMTGPDGEITCVTCHAVHGTQGQKLLIAPYGREGTGTLCRLCHPEGTENGHPTGITPADGRPLPDRYEQGGSGQITCSTCHAVHGTEKETNAVALKTPADGSTECEECHHRPAAPAFSHLDRDLNGERKARIETLGGKLNRTRIACRTCHTPHGGRSAKALIEKYEDGAPSGLCGTCHKTQAVTGKTAPGKSQPCAECHEFHGKPPRASSGNTGPCLTCHPGRKGKGEHTTGEGSGCSCHSIHKPAEGENRLAAEKTGQALCTGCHDSINMVHGGAIQPESIDRPLLLRRGINLDENWMVNCLTCHTPHNAPEKSLLAPSEESICLYCHKKQNPYGPQGKKPGAHPVGVALTRTETGYLKSIRTGEPGTAGEKERRDRFETLLTCSSCHRAHSREPVINATCAGCHQEHQTSKAHEEKGGCAACHPIHGETPPGKLCVTCHEQTDDGIHTQTGATDKTGRKTAPGATCTVCHDPHRKNGTGTRPSGKTGLCAGCHPEKAGMEGSSHDPRNLRDKGEKGLCEPCHPAHVKTPDARPQSERCGDCHENTVECATGHSDQGRMALGGKTAALPYFDRFGKRNNYGFVSCPTCHDLHKPAGQGTLRLSDRTPPSLCLACHPEKQTLFGSAHDISEGGEKTGEAPCALCHKMHAVGVGALSWQLSEKAWGTWNDRKCSPCHGPPETANPPLSGKGSHKMNLPLPEGMETGGLPLYGPTGLKGGRTFTCSTCHNIHGQADDYGAQIPGLLRKPADAGTLCITCHPEKNTIVKTPHDTNAPDRPLGHCSPCHTAHGHDPMRPLWALEPHPDAIGKNKYCMTCHNTKAEGTGKPPRMNHHMKDAEPVYGPRGSIYLQRPMILEDETLARAGKASEIPLFGINGDRTSYGYLQCVSCHDPHLWAPEAPAAKPMKNTKWAITTKFLKLPSPEQAASTLCRTCHPKDTAKYYLHYHDVWGE